jgi:hypothetical protein
MNPTELHAYVFDMTRVPFKASKEGAPNKCTAHQNIRLAYFPYPGRRMLIGGETEEDTFWTSKVEAVTLTSDLVVIHTQNSRYELSNARKREVVDPAGAE